MSSFPLHSGDLSQPIAHMVHSRFYQVNEGWPTNHVASYWQSHKTKYNDGFHYAIFLWLSWSNPQTSWGIKPQPMTSTRPCFSCGLFFALDYLPQTVRASSLFLTELEYVPITEAFSLWFCLSGIIFLQLFACLSSSLYPQSPPCLKDQISQLHHSIPIYIFL